MSETAIVSSAPGDLHDRVRMSTTSEGGSLLEQLRAAYQGLGREERQQVQKPNADGIEEQQRFTGVEREHYLKLPAPSLARRLVSDKGNEDVPLSRRRWSTSWASAISKKSPDESFRGTGRQKTEKGESNEIRK